MNIFNQNKFTFTERSHITGNARSKCKLTRKQAFWVALAFLPLILGIAFFVGGYLVGAATDTPDDFHVDTDAQEEYIQELPPLIWDGICPKKNLSCPHSYTGVPPLILISLDGFRPDYLKRGFSPTIEKISRCGTSADYMYSVFPTKTFPNHFSQVTGLYPSFHGIIDNIIYDEKTKRTFKISNKEALNPYWWEKEPIWVTARKQGKIIGSFFWPGSEVKINGYYPNYYKKYNSRIPFAKRVDEVLRWLDLPIGERPAFITLYANQPDNAGHKFGTVSNVTNKVLTDVDKMIERLLSGLQQRQLINCVNIIIVSDHGMSNIDCERVVNIANYANMSDVYTTTMGPFARLRQKKGKRNETLIRNLISQLSCQSSHMRSYAKEQLPVRYHYSAHHRIEPIFLDMDAGWTVVSKPVEPKDYICTGGAHGYDNLFPDMQALFVAFGPSFKRNYTSRPFINTELYEMLTELINITSNPNNGTRGSLHHMLASPRKLPPQEEPFPPTTGDVPKDEMEYKFREYAANCSCSQSQKQVDVKNIVEQNNLHMPFGVPYLPEDNSTLRLLYNDDYIAAFDLKYRIPMWTSFTLKGKKISDNLSNICWRGDARIHISDTSQCGDYKTSIVSNQYILQRPVYPYYFSDNSKFEQANYVSNSIPKSLNHTNILEKRMYQILGQWAYEENQLNVIIGPAFNSLANGVRPDIETIMRTHEKFGPVVVSTHIFVIATWCTDKTKDLKACNASHLEATAFLLPNSPFLNNCLSANEIITKNIARIVDIEKLTGISFFTGLPTYDAIRLRTLMPTKTPN